MNTFMDALTKNEKSYTANDGTAYHTSGSPLVDLNFSVPALRQVVVDFYGRLIFMVKVNMTDISMVQIALWMLWKYCAYLLHPMRKTLCIP